MDLSANAEVSFCEPSELSRLEGRAYQLKVQ